MCVLAAEPAVTEVRAGESLTFTGGPYTSPEDTVLVAGSVRAAASDVTRTGCAICDSCRDDHGCDPGCADSCNSCVETATFVVPDAAPGPLEVTVVDGWGSSAPIPLVVVDADDTDGS